MAFNDEIMVASGVEYDPEHPSTEKATLENIHPNTPYNVDTNFVGTVAEWNALSLSEKAKYKTVDFIDDYTPSPIDDFPTEGSGNAVSSGGVYTELGKAYRDTDSSSSTINDTDYIPISDANGNKKKSLWSNIVDKIKTALGIASSGSTYLKKDGTWGTPTNTTYTFATGDSNGQIKVTPSGGTAQNVSVKGLGSSAYLNADTENTEDTVVKRDEYGNVKATLFQFTTNAAAPTYWSSSTPLYQHDGYIMRSSKSDYLSWLFSGGEAYTAWKTNSSGTPGWDLDVVVIPQVHYSSLPSKSTQDTTYFKEWLVYICQNYTAKLNSARPIVCRVNPNSIGICIGIVYSASAVHSTTKLPRYSSFFYVPLGTGAPKRFGTLDYEYYFTS